MIEKVDIKVPEDVKYLCEKIEKNGYSAYVVGGGVRDYILGKEPKDWDITTNATYDQILECLKEDVMEIPYGQSKEYNVFFGYYNNEKYEIATFRTDEMYLDHRHPITRVADSIEEDLKRRDFTINAMAYSPKKAELIDLYDGVGDLKNGIIRAVGKAEERINEDALRILRAYRFSANMGFGIDEELEKVCSEKFLDLKHCSMERKRDEINKLLNKEIKNFNSGKTLLSILEDNLDNKKIEQVNKNIGDIEIQLAIILQDKTPEEISKVLNDFKYDKELIRNVNVLVRDKEVEFTNKEDIKKYLSHNKEENFSKLLKMKNEINPEFGVEKYVLLKTCFNEIKKSGEPYRINHLKINGDDLVERGYAGKEVGDKLEKLLAVVISNPLYNNREILLSMSNKDPECEKEPGDEGMF